jgi:hypothetical protein
MDTKRCDTCKVHLETAEFHKNRYKHDGLASTCKTCTRANADRKREHYERLITQQEGKCAICEKSVEDNRKDFAVDHCHATDVVRGALCNHCNSGLGGFMDNPDLLYKGIVYLMTPRGEHV